jgi:hypothetical protein
VGPRAGLDTDVRGKILYSLPGIEPRSPGRTASNQTLYSLSYPGSSSIVNDNENCLLRVDFRQCQEEFLGLSVQQEMYSWPG